ncbi:MAG TPA: energy-coupling factor transporter transmembrane component T [Actinomycetota bacterium]|nr:energy-coupling factor transporter transmembrane component T [Actinomycetota bacterium]
MTSFYVEGSGWLHRRHPWPKLLAAIWAVLAPFLLPPVALPFLLAGAVAVALASGLGRTYLRRLAWGTLPLVASIVLVNGFFLPGARDVLLSLGPFHLTREGLALALPTAGRVVAAVGATLAFVSSTRPDDLMEALIERGASPKLAFVVLSTIQMVPRTLDRSARIVDAQRSRGLPTGGSVRNRARAIVPLVGPLIIGSLVDVRERALALEARAFGAAHRRTAYRILSRDRTDRLLEAAAWAGFLLLAAYVALRVARAVG